MKIKSYLTITMLCLLYTSGNAQTSTALFASLEPTAGASLQYFCAGEVPQEAITDLYNLLTHLKNRQKRYHAQIDFLKWVFYYVHRKYLKRYQKQSTFAGLLTKGRYNCVTGTALYALLMQELNIPCQIWEMDYHCYLTIQAGGQTVMLEASDAENGFIADPSQIQYSTDLALADARSYHTRMGICRPPIHQTITLPQLAGLQFYNLSIEQYMKRQVWLAHQQILKALDLYPSERIIIFEGLVAQKKYALAKVVNTTHP